MLQTFFTRRALKEKLGTQKQFHGSFKVTPRALQGHLSTWALEGHLETWGLGHSRQMGTWSLGALEGTLAFRHLSTWALRHSGTHALGQSRHFN